ncbi:hypothetical protein [Pseudoramibacter faecis]|uniref:hypothetical protein n=1 Tax=Pseudoramibacter faecis TaxID=3108534 RepID=UPI002E7914DD|nr:hypothetical protein [Pseudoramibacter sp. HA2172]
MEKNSVQETLIILLLGRLVCSERFQALFSDPEAKRICDSLDYDFAEKRKNLSPRRGSSVHWRWRSGSTTCAVRSKRI